jgi:uncharacterized membrane protein SpoIIM required for sporulation
MENLMIILIITLVFMFVMVFVVSSLVIGYMVLKERKQTEQIKLNISMEEARKKEEERIKSEVDLENIKLQLEYEDILKNIKERGVSLAKGIQQTFEEIDKGE